MILHGLVYVAEIHLQFPSVLISLLKIQVVIATESLLVEMEEGPPIIGLQQIQKPGF